MFYKKDAMRGVYFFNILMYNLKLKNKQIRKAVCSPIWWHCVRWWIEKTEGDNVDIEQTQVEGCLAGASINDPTDLPNFHNIVFDDDVDEQFSSREELDGDDFIRRLNEGDL